MLSSQIDEHREDIEKIISEAAERVKNEVPLAYKESYLKLTKFWSQLLSSLEERFVDMENCKEQWLCFSFELQQVMGDLADSEMELCKSKEKQHLSRESIIDEIQKNKVT